MSYKIEIPVGDEVGMEAFHELMAALSEEMVDYTETIAKELQVSLMCAADVVYLRGRSRWTQELEDELIRLYKEGNPPNINEFGN
jgi:hypothetical protein